MRASRLGWLVVAGLVLVSARPAAGQSVGYQLNRFEPTPAGEPFSVVEYPWYSATRWYAGGLTLDYAHNLVSAKQQDASGALVSAPSPIANQLQAHLDLAGSLWDRVALTLSLPIMLYENGTPLSGVGPSGAAVGDPRVGVRARIWGQPDSTVSLSGGVYVWIPIGAQHKLVGDDGPRVMPRITVGGLAFDHLRWAANVSVLARGKAQLSNTLSGAGNSVGSDVELAAALAWVGLGHRLSVGPEAILSLAVSDLPAGQKVATLELLASAHYLVADLVQLGIGAGFGAAGTPGPPDARVFFSIAWAPLRKHTSSFERVVVLPDEDGHIGGVEVNDGKKQTLLDKAYASTEISKKAPTLRPVQSSPAALPAQVGALAATLPPTDRDRDGIADAADACPERPGVASPDPVRNGCPPASEKVVVLPDADGHVGGVEVDDGQRKALIDKPYGSTEVGTDGAVRAVPPAPAKAVQRAVAQVAKTLPVTDSDGDGVPDDADACPDRPGVRSADPVRNGCPEAKEKVVVLPDPNGHVGGVEVDDGHGKTLIDQAYGSVEVGGDGTAQAVPPAPAHAVEHAVAAVAKTLPVADNDGDGIRDEDDACPDRVGVASPDALRNGCPKAAEKVVVLPDADGHVGAVEVSDGTHKTLLDKAYASAEVVDGRVRAVKPSPAPSLLRATAAIAKTLPMLDRDDDGVADGEDACPDRAGLPSSNPARHGCPKTTERVVVLPDENGHVGAVEVDDGKQKTLLDQAYASAEVGIDGMTQKLTADASEVSLKFDKAMAARPAGARIILYFTARSEPVRDLTGPIDNLVAEIKAKKGEYQVEVVGHTDQTGSEQLNLRIGLERAQVIAQRLVAAGVPAERVHVSSKGSAEPAVKLKDRRVVELRNRRVEVWVK